MIRERIKAVCLDFSSTTTVTGLAPVAYYANRWHTIFWITCLLTMLAYSLFQCYGLFKYFGTNPVNVAIKLEHRQLDFPSVTICSLNPFKQSLIEENAPQINGMIQAVEQTTNNLSDIISSMQSRSKRDANLEESGIHFRRKRAGSGFTGDYTGGEMYVNNLPKCEPDWYQMESYCVYFNCSFTPPNSYLNSQWQTAEQCCESQGPGSTLLTMPTDSLWQQFVPSYLNIWETFCYSLSGGNLQACNVWMGMSYNSSVWKWFSGQAVDVTNWWSGEPGGVPLPGSNDVAYLAYNTNTLSWYFHSWSRTTPNQAYTVCTKYSPITSTSSSTTPMVSTTSSSSIQQTTTPTSSSTQVTSPSAGTTQLIDYEVKTTNEITTSAALSTSTLLETSSTTDLRSTSSIYDVTTLALSTSTIFDTSSTTDLTSSLSISTTSSTSQISSTSSTTSLITTFKPLTFSSLATTSIKFLTSTSRSSETIRSTNLNMTSSSGLTKIISNPSIQNYQSGQPTTESVLTVEQYRQQYVDTIMENVNENTNPLSLTTSAKKDLIYMSTDFGIHKSSALSYTVEEIIYKCTYNTTNCDSRDFQKFYYPSYGNCFEFNSDINVDKIAQLSGEYYGLKLLLKIDEAEYLKISDTVGYRVVVHKKSTPTFPDTMGFNVSPGYITSIQFRLINYNKMDPPFGNCNNSANYSIEGCQRMYQQKFIIEKCGCGDPSNSLPAVDHYCGSRSQACVDAAKDSQEYAAHFSNCKCPTVCKETIYQTTVTTSKIKEIAQFTSYDKGNTTLLKLNIFFDSLSVSSYTEMEAYPFGMLISDFGNGIGWIVGFSAISVVEVIVFVIEMITVPFVYNRNKH